MRAVELKYEGFHSEEISAALRQELGVTFTAAAIRYWFCRNGMLHQFFIDYADRRNNEVMEESMRAFKRDLPYAMAKLKQQMNVPGAGIGAAKEWIDRALGPQMALPGQEINVNVNVGIIAENVNLAVDAFRHYGIVAPENQPADGAGNGGKPSGA